MNETRIAIIGGGPMCTYALERLAARFSQCPSAAPVRLSIFERTGRFGAGTAHSDQQPETSFMNRAAGQITFAADESNLDLAPLLPKPERPTFEEWCKRKYAETGDDRFVVAPTDVPPRYLHGLALRERFDRYIAILRRSGRVDVDLYGNDVLDVSGDGDGYRLHVRGLDAPVDVDSILFVTGHSHNRPAPGSATERLIAHAPSRFILDPYPLEQLDESIVPPGARAGVLGLGLTAIDVILYLTEGRGGRFVPKEKSPDRLRYLPSGREPAPLTAVSPSGLFVGCRPLNAKIASGTKLQHCGVFLTREAVATLREHLGRPSGAICQLDFDLHVFPLIILEMAYVYFVTLLGPEAAERIRSAAEPRYRQFLRTGCNSSEAGADWLLEPVMECAEQRFDWRRILDPLTAADAVNGDVWRARLIAFVEHDLGAAEENNLRNPVKAACDGVWRDLRSVIAAAADRGGLLPASQRHFMARHLRYYNRLSNGSGILPIRKVLALLEHGVLDAAVGPGPVVESSEGNAPFRIIGSQTGVVRDVDVLIEGKVHPFDPVLDANPLYPNLLRRGLARQWRNRGENPGDDFVPGALDLDEYFHPIGPNGKSDERLTFIGAPAEGLMFFQLTAARPYANSDVLNHVGRWADTIAQSIAVPRPAL